MNIILGITGSISAFKAVDLMRLFQKNGHEVSVILTRSAGEFVGAITFETFCPGRVYSEMFEKHQDPLVHINLQAKDLLLIAPASANIIGKMANGIADDLLSSTFLAFYKTVVVAPAMNSHMYENPAVQDNITRLRSRGIHIIEPEEGSLACNTVGKGKFPEPGKIYDFCIKIMTGTIEV